MGDLREPRSLSDYKGDNTWSKTDDLREPRSLSEYDGDNSADVMFPPIKQRIESLIKRSRGAVGFVRNNKVDYAHPTYVSEMPRLLEEAIQLLEETYKDKY